MGYIVNVFRLKFDILQIEVWLPKDKLKKIIKRVAKILERKSSISYEELQSLVSHLFFAVKIICLDQASLWQLYDELAKGGKNFHQSKPIRNLFLHGKKFFLKRKKSYYYIFTPMLFFIDWYILYRSFAKICLLATKFDIIAE